MANGNGELINEVDALLERRIISEEAAIKMLLKLVRGVYVKVDDVGNLATDNQRRIVDLETANKVEDAGREKVLTWPYLLEKFGQPLFMIIIAAIVGYLIGGGGG